jgi:hypothetical protein
MLTHSPVSWRFAGCTRCADRASTALARAAFVAQEKPLYDTLRLAELVLMGRALNQV